MKKGSILEFKRAGGLFYHYGMYIGENKVIHRDKNENGSIFVTDLKDMVGEMKIVSPKYPRVPTQQAIDKAFEMRESNLEYNVFTNNCEHFVNFVRYKRMYSKQVRRFAIFIGYVSALLLGKQRLSDERK
jgi:hypothetical protein